MPGPWPGQARAACAVLRARTANRGGSGASKMDASWVLGPAGVKKGQVAVGVAVGIGGLKVFCEKISLELAPRMLWGRCCDELWQLVTW